MAIRFGMAIRPLQIPAADQIARTETKGARNTVAV